MTGGLIVLLTGNQWTRPIAAKYTSQTGISQAELSRVDTPTERVPVICWAIRALKQDKLAPRKSNEGRPPSATRTQHRQFQSCPFDYDVNVCILNPCDLALILQEPFTSS